MTTGYEIPPVFTDPNTTSLVTPIRLRRELFPGGPETGFQQTTTGGPSLVPPIDERLTALAEKVDALVNLFTEANPQGRTQ